MKILQKMITKISVIIPTYNCAEFLENAIRSALNQTYKNTEIIVINDCSTDNTDEIVEKFNRKLVYIKQKVNKGAAAARNEGIEAAKGEFIALLDADDEWLSHRLEIMMMSLAERKADFVTSNAYIKINNIITSQKIYPNYDIRFDLDVKQQYLKALGKNFIFSMCMMKKDILLDVGLFDSQLRYHEDWDMWLRLLKKGYRSGLVNELSAIYTVREGSSTNTSNLRKAEDHMKILNKHRDFISNKAYNIVSGSVNSHKFRETINNNKILSAYFLFKTLMNYDYLSEVVFPEISKKLIRNSKCKR